MKATIDKTAAATLLIATSPLMAAAAVAIRVQMGSPVLFRQTRPGYGGEPFQIFKFRTMSDARDAEGNLLPDGERLTTVGQLLRKASIDELPQLLNVLRGEMSLVGPRPLLMRYLDRYSPRQRLRLWAKPGITGWAQVHGRNAIDWETRLELDAWYVENASIWLDLRILALTAAQLLRHEDVKAGGTADFDEFRGSEGQPATQTGAV
ncbi:MAG TPA: sugar transferase [Polyangiaceae bacterium]|nr:sugar transferase [Polyangiaceae bacterium]